jgi:phenol 2-monooxygenase
MSNYLHRHFQTFGGFSSNVGIHYQTSTITNAQYQHLAQHLPIGQRMIPQVFIRAADGRPVEIQDMLPSDTRIGILVFTGDVATPKDFEKLEELSDKLQNVLATFSQNTKPWTEAFRVISIAGPSLRKVDGAHLALPSSLRSHWSR